MSITVTVRYVDGSEAAACVWDWPSLRSDGVDYVDVCGEDGVKDRIQGQSVYYLHAEDDHWVIGGGIVGDREMIEVVVPGHQWRHPTRLRDLRHDQIKLGHWLPEESG